MRTFCCRLVAVSALMVALSGAASWRAARAVPASYYVAPSGNDADPGTADRPWRTVQRAANALTAGQTVYLRAGTYRERVVPRNSGAAGAPITYAAYPGEMPILDGATVALPDDLHGLFEIANQSYISVVGLRLINAGPHGNNTGILVDRAQHIVLEANQTANTVSSGIGVWASQYVTVTRNTIAEACAGGWQECLSVAETTYFEVTGNFISACHKEGLCVKDASAHGTVRDNHISQCDATGLYTDAWERHTHDILVTMNTVHHTGANGIALASEQGGLLENVRLHNNVVYANRWVGILISTNGIAGPMRDLAVVNNTVYGNGDEWGGGIAVDNGRARGVLIRNNLVAGNRTFGLAHGAGLPVGELTVDHNLTDACLEDADELCGGSQVAVGDPRYTNPSGGDFHLLPESAAIDAGSHVAAPAADRDGLPRPLDGNGDAVAVHDIGAYERLVQAHWLYIPAARR